MRRILLFVLALALVGCGDDEPELFVASSEVRKNGTVSVVWGNGVRAANDVCPYTARDIWEIHQNIAAAHRLARGVWKIPLDTRDCVTIDSFIVRYDTTGWEKRNILISTDSVKYCQFRYAPHRGTTKILWVADTVTYWEKVPKYKSMWVPIVQPTYAPKIVVQLTPDEHKKLMEIITAEKR